MPPARRSARTASSNIRNASHPYTRANSNTSPTSSRPSAASIARPANGKTSLRLTVKAAPSKLRQATSGSNGTGSSIPPNPYAADSNADDSDATPAPPATTRTARATRNPRTVVEPESDEDEDEEEVEQDEDEEMGDDDEAEDDEEDVEEREQELDEGEESEGEEEDAEGEEDDEDMEDELQQDHPPPPTIIVRPDKSSGGKASKPNVTVTAPPEGTLKSVEAKEMEMDDEEEEEELTEMDSNENEEENGEEDEEDDDSDSSNDISRSATPDLSKLTRRQRGLYEDTDASGLMSLSNEAQKKKHLTAEEHAMRRQEMARRRKNLSEKRNEEEKMSTIDKLLKKPAPKRRTRAEILAAQHAEMSMGTPGMDDEEYERPDPVFVRWVQSKEGSRLGVPEEWMESPVGEVFKGGPGGGAGGGRMLVEEVA